MDCVALSTGGATRNGWPTRWSGKIEDAPFASRPEVSGSGRQWIRLRSPQEDAAPPNFNCFRPKTNATLDPERKGRPPARREPHPLHKSCLLAICASTHCDIETSRLVQIGRRVVACGNLRA